MGLHTGADLKKLTEEELIARFGKSGKFYYNIVRGIDHRAVQPYRESKSLAAEDTFEYDLIRIEEMHKELSKLADKVTGRLEKKQLRGRTITLKIKYSDFSIITRSQSFDTPVSDYQTIYETATALLENTDLENRMIRLLGISLSNFGEPNLNIRPSGNPYQLQLFD